MDKQALGTATSLGIQIGLIMTGCFLGGYKLDVYLKTLPLFTLLLCAAGFALTLYIVIKAAKKM